MIPEFEEKVLERRPPEGGTGASGTIVVQDWKGNICEISDEFDTRYLRDAIDFVTRRWIRCPVRSRSEWPDMARRYDAADAARLPADFGQRTQTLARRDYVSTLNFSGPFWQLREWLGFEGLCLLLMDDPSFAQEMIDFWRQFVSRLLARVLPCYVPDVVTISEDMAYKHKPMISPAMARRVLLPCWRQWAEQCRAAGVAVVEMDSDGYVADLIPLWIEAGIHCNSPLEVAAGNDLPTYRQRFGRRMAYRGGVDKRAMAAGGEVLVKEIQRLRPVIEAGGYIPSCDHGIPPDVSWPNFVEYCRLLAQATGWL
jgi:uroporphyrinogen decarboxylase